MKPADVDWKSVRTMLEIQHHAYRCAKEGEALPFPGYHVELKREGLHQGILLEGDGPSAVLAVCGSNQLGDHLRINAAAWPVRRAGRPGRWHAGFAAAGDVIGSWIPNRRVVLICHSMGAAATLNAAADLHCKRIAGLLAIDPPRIAWGRKAAEWLGKHLPCNAFRLTAGASVVAHVPPKCFGYQETPIRTIHLSHSGQVLDRPRTTAEWCRDVWDARRLDGLQLIGDHVITGIEKLIAAHEAAGEQLL